MNSFVQKGQEDIKGTVHPKM